MTAPASITITPVFVADLHVEGERMPVYVHIIDHPEGRVLVDTGMTELHPLMAGMDPRLRALSEQDLLAGIDIVVNTHLHADHCGGNHLFAGKPIYGTTTTRAGTPASASGACPSHRTPSATRPTSPA